MLDQRYWIYGNLDWHQIKQRGPSFGLRISAFPRCESMKVCTASGRRSRENAEGEKAKVSFYRLVYGKVASRAFCGLLSTFTHNQHKINTQIAHETWNFIKYTTHQKMHRKWGKLYTFHIQYYLQVYLMYDWKHCVTAVSVEGKWSFWAISRKNGFPYYSKWEHVQTELKLQEIRGLMIHMMYTKKNMRPHIH